MGSIVVSVALNGDHALLLEKVSPVAKEQRIVVGSVRKAVKVRDEYVLINTNLVRWQDELAKYFTSFLMSSTGSMPPTLFDDCCLVCGRETDFPLSHC